MTNSWDVRIINLRQVRQAFDFDCGVSAFQAVLEYYGIEMRTDDLMQELGTDQAGTRHHNMVALAEKKGFEVFASDHVSLDKVRRFVAEGHPVIVLLQAWAERYMTLKDWQADYDDGHYAIVIGFQGPIVVFEDPASARHTWLREEEFLARWHDRDPKTNGKLEQFAMVLMGKEPVSRTPVHMD